MATFPRGGFGGGECLPASGFWLSAFTGPTWLRTEGGRPWLRCLNLTNGWLCLKIHQMGTDRGRYDCLFRTGWCCPNDEGRFGGYGQACRTPSIRTKTLQSHGGNRTVVTY